MSPPFAGIKAGINYHVGKHHVGDISLAPLKDADAPVRFINVDIIKQQVT